MAVLRELFPGNVRLFEQTEEALNPARFPGEQPAGGGPTQREAGGPAGPSTAEGDEMGEADGDHEAETGEPADSWVDEFGNEGPAGTPQGAAGDDDGDHAGSEGEEALAPEDDVGGLYVEGGTSDLGMLARVVDPSGAGRDYFEALDDLEDIDVDPICPKELYTVTPLVGGQEQRRTVGLSEGYHYACRGGALRHLCALEYGCLFVVEPREAESTEELIGDPDGRRSKNAWFDLHPRHILSKEGYANRSADD